MYTQLFHSGKKEKGIEAESADVPAWLLAV